ncbi:hypothetical protein [Rhodonellum sp.]|uniref:hypothetical protein n=1 Tax=Rhodonellum sp. TaxID=2231180 RepID=UPI002718772E|nr:hypothetical protein [Rhodonellum sp.]MDO9554940.1 hypothetical protein [Rhodonellum sp.]
MKKFNPKRPLWLYQLWEYLLLFDGKSEEDRVLAYRYGWFIYSKNKLHFEDFSRFLIRRKWFIYLSLVYPIMIALFSLLFALSFLKLEVWMILPLAFLFSGLTGTIIYMLIGNTLKNIRETKIFLTYVDPTHKINNFREFENLGYWDQEGAESFYENMRAKRDYVPIESFQNRLDKTEKLLAIDILLGEPGTFNELINKLCHDPKNSLTKEGIYRVLGEILTASSDNIKKDITKGVKEIRIGDKLSAKRIDQLKNVKEVFFNAKLGMKASEIDQMMFR